MAYSMETSSILGKRDADRMTADSPLRKGRACLACRKLKVKCDSLDQGDTGCSRCKRLNLRCVMSQRVRINPEDGSDTSHPSIPKLEKAVEDILERLKMPSLASYSQVQHVPESVAQTTRENSREPQPEGEQDMAGAPMGSLYEATQLNTLRARLKYSDVNRQTLKRKLDNDLISQGRLTLQEAEEMFHMFKTSLSRYLFDATVAEERTLQSVREASTILFTAIMVVAALHIPGKEKIHLMCHKQFRELIAASMFDQSHTLEDIRGLCIAAFWSPDLSWKLSGHCIRMATELNLHQAFYRAFYAPKQTERDRENAFESARLWYLLYVLDHHFSIAYGRPPVTAELQAIKEYEVFLNAAECTASDRRVLSQVSLFLILSKAYSEFGLEAERLMEGDDLTLLTHLRFLEDLDRWRHHFRHALCTDEHVGDYPAVGVELHYNFASMMLNSLALRGRSLVTLGNLPSSLRPLALRAIEAAHRILQIVLDEPSIRESMVGIPLYLHTMIAFAIVFLIKLSFRWRAIGVTIDPETRTKPLIQRVIHMMQNCRAGANHIIYSMSTGFDRLLHRNLVAQPGSTGEQWQKHSDVFIKPQPRHTSEHARPSFDNSRNLSFDQNAVRRSGSVYENFDMSPQSVATFGGWQNEDDMWWSMGMGYDLLANQPDVSGVSNAYHDMIYPSMQ